MAALHKRLITFLAIIPLSDVTCHKSKVWNGFWAFNEVFLLIYDCHNVVIVRLILWQKKKKKNTKKIQTW